MQKLRNLLLVAYHFPPHGGSGVQRALKLARYLPPAGWRAHILTAGHDHYPVLDRTLCAEYDNAYVHRVTGWEPAAMAKRMAAPLTPLFKKNHCGLEDRLYWRLDRWMRQLPLAELEQLWTPSATRRARRLIHQHAIEAVVTTSPPCATHWVGRNLRRQFSIPWIADLRDPILDNFSYRPTSGRADQYFRRLETTIAQKADRIVVTCPELAERLRHRYADAPPDRFTTITNGYDPADAPVDARTAPSRRFTLAHVGALYREQSVGPILDAVRKLRASRPDIRDGLQLRLIGTLSATEKALLQPADSSFLYQSGSVDHSSAIAEMATADALLLTAPASDGGRLCIPAKSFEYLAFGKHIIASLHESSWIARTLRQACNCTLISSTAAGAWCDAIATSFAAWKAGRLQEPRDRAIVETFRRDRIAARYALVVEEVVAALGSRQPLSVPMTEAVA